MHRFLLVLSGASLAFSSVCTMAFAQIAPSSEGGTAAHEEACGAAEAADASGGASTACTQERTPCEDGSCFLSSAMENGVLSPPSPSLLAAAALPPAGNLPLPVLSDAPQDAASGAPRAPPDLLSSVVLRE